MPRTRFAPAGTSRHFNHATPFTIHRRLPDRFPGVIEQPQPVFNLGAPPSLSSVPGMELMAWTFNIPRLYHPAEQICIASDWRYTHKLPPEFPPSMVKFSSYSPRDRLSLISSGINDSIMRPVF
ncbi:hypothetical protein M405DRAFT_444732 [Rhizopogon salebrosus TDB-379]|nr:hypothetical protein M405DRAFT_444732 [Rhizopogon salebrosus TDB-379]